MKKFSQANGEVITIRVSKRPKERALFDRVAYFLFKIKHL